MKEKKSNITVIIRSAHERTESLCKELVCQQVPEANIHVIHEVPFSKAVLKTFEIGIDCNKDWTLGLDADILLNSTAITSLIDTAESLPQFFFEVQGGVLDKLFGTKRAGGPHLFRTQLIPKALSLIPEEGLTLRPEATVIKAMAGKNHHFYQGLDTYGIHDYHQYYRDIYRKSFIHAHKSIDWLNIFEENWKQKATEDPDYQVALLGLQKGKSHKGKVYINANLIREEINQVLQKEGISEKEEIILSRFNPKYPDQVQQQHQPVGPLKDFEEKIFSKVKRSDLRKRKQKNLLQRGIKKIKKTFFDS